MTTTSYRGYKIITTDRDNHIVYQDTTIKDYPRTLELELGVRHTLAGAKKFIDQLIEGEALPDFYQNLR